MADRCERSGGELSSTNVDFTSVAGAINCIRKKSIRPDLTSIYQYLRKQGLACEETEVSDTVKALIEDGLIENKPYRGEDSFYVRAKPNIISELKSPIDQDKLKLNECKNKDNLHDEINKIWLLLDLLCREGQGTYKCANESLLEKRICQLENQIEMLQSENKSISATNEMLQRELNEAAFCKGNFFDKKSSNDYYIDITNPYQRHTTECRPSHGRGAATTTKSVISRATEQAKLDKLIPQRPNAIALHNRYSILSDSDFNERNEDHNSNYENNVDGNYDQNKKNSTENQHLQTRKTINDQNQNRPTNTPKQSRNTRNERSSVLILGDSIPKHVDGLKMHKSLKRKHNITVKAFSGSTIKHMEHYSKPPLERNPELVILHIGTNDIKSNKSPQEIATGIQNLAQNMEEEGKRKVAISSLIPRNDSQELAKKSVLVNSELKKLCMEKGLDLIQHPSLTARHLNGSNLHLNRFGTAIFANDLMRYIRD